MNSERRVVGERQALAYLFWSFFLAAVGSFMLGTVFGVILVMLSRR
jgi:hypothetical protein